MKYRVMPTLEFDEADLHPSSYWFLDTTHSIPPWTPMFGWFWITYCRHGMQYGAETLSLPTVSGCDWRFKDGGGYLTVLHVTDEAEVQRRSERFRTAIKPFIEDYDNLWNGFKQEMLDRYAALKRRDLDTASNLELLQQLDETCATAQRMWEIHMYMMYGVFVLYLLFEDLCRDLLGIDDTSPEFHQLLRGFDNKVFQVDRSLWVLARNADAAGLAPIFLQEDPADIPGRLKQSEAGRAWLQRFGDFLNEDGWRIQRMAEINLPTWVEDPTPPLQTIRQFLTTGADFNLDAKRELLAKEREAAERTVLTRVPAAERGWFETLLRVAQRAGGFSEEHNHYLDLYCHAVIRHSIMGIGRRLAAAGCTEKVDDVLFLVPDELRKVLLTPSFHDLRPVVNERRAAWEAWQQQENPPLMGQLDLEQAVGRLVASRDPIIMKVIVGNLPQPDLSAGADLYGVCGSPGVVEGTARVILDQDRLHEIQPGEILVAVSTSPSWTSVFGLLSGVVLDRGGSLSHAAVVGREYGIPVVTNVFEGTKAIKTGQRLRVDGSRGQVFILDHEGA